MKYLMILMASIFAQSTHALVLDFDAIPFTASGSGISLATQGYRLLGTNAGFHIIFAGGGPPTGPTGCDPECPYNGTNYLFAQTFAEWQIARDDQATFSLLSFEGAESFEGRAADHWARRVRVDGTVAGGGIVWATFDLDFFQDGIEPGNDFQVFALPSVFVNLTAVRFSGTDGLLWNDFSLDNIIVVEASTATPAPATLALLTLGLCGLGFSRRRKSVAA